MVMGSLGYRREITIEKILLTLGGVKGKIAFGNSLGIPNRYQAERNLHDEKAGQ